MDTKTLKHTRWLSVDTPSVFREIKIIDIDNPTASEQRKMDRLADLAEMHGTHVATTTYPRG